MVGEELRLGTVVGKQEHHNANYCKKEKKKKKKKKKLSVKKNLISLIK